MWHKSSFLVNTQKSLNERKSAKIRDFPRPIGYQLGLFFIRALKKNATLRARELGDEEVAHLITSCSC